MMKYFFVSWWLFAALSHLGCGSRDLPQGDMDTIDVVPNSYILGLWDQTSTGNVSQLLEPLANVGSKVEFEVIGRVELSQSSQVLAANSFLSKPLSEKKSAMTLFRVDLSEGSSSSDVFTSVDANLVALWEPNRINHLFVSRQVPVSILNHQRPWRTTFTSDNFFADLYERYQDNGGQWWLDAIRVDRVFEALGKRDLEKLPDSTLEQQAPVIAILDSGIDYLHPALSAKVWVNPSPGLSGCENDEYGCDTTVGSAHPLGMGPAIPFATEKPGESCPIEIIQGKAFLNGACIHGTHVAGLIVANDESGVSGICPQCKFLSIKVVENIEGEGKVPDSAILKGLKYVQNINQLHGGLVKVVNSSFGKFEQSLSVTLLVKELMESGVVVVGASGNENTSERVFPAALEEVIGVTAISREGKKASYANFGSWISLSAPGGDVERGSRSDEAISSTVPGGGVYLSQGTSVASPLVAGVAGLIQMLEPNLYGVYLQKRLLGSANRKLYDIDFADGYNSPYGPKYGKDDLPGLLGRGILDGFAAYLGEFNDAGSLTNSQRVSPECGHIIVKNSAAELPYFVLIMCYLMPIILIAVRRKGGA